MDKLPDVSKADLIELHAHDLQKRSELAFCDKLFLALWERYERVKLENERLKGEVDSQAKKE